MSTPTLLENLADVAAAEQIEANDRAIERATKAMAEENAALEKRIALTQEQTQALRALLREQETYLSEVDTQVARMEARRLDWRRRYKELIGSSLDEPLTVGF